MRLHAFRRWFLVFSFRILVFLVHSSKRYSKDSFHQLMSDSGGKCIICFLGVWSSAGCPSPSKTWGRLYRLNGLNLELRVGRRRRQVNPVSHVVSSRSRGCTYVKSTNEEPVFTDNLSCVSEVCAHFPSL